MRTADFILHLDKKTQEADAWAPPQGIQPYFQKVVTHKTQGHGEWPSLPVLISDPWLRAEAGFQAPSLFCTDHTAFFCISPRHLCCLIVKCVLWHVCGLCISGHSHSQPCVIKRSGTLPASSHPYFHRLSTHTQVPEPSRSCSLSNFLYCDYAVFIGTPTTS